MPTQLEHMLMFVVRVDWESEQVKLGTVAARTGVAVAASPCGGDGCRMRSRDTIGRIGTTNLGLVVVGNAVDSDPSARTRS
jgi:hypothetical protein